MEGKTDIIVPLAVKVHGEYALEVVDTRSGAVTHQRGFRRNLLLDEYLDRHIEELKIGIVMWGGDSADGMVSNIGSAECEVGTDATAPARSQTGVLAKVATANRDSSRLSVSDVADNPSWRQEVFILPAGTYTGAVRELALIAGRDFAVARQLVEPEITLESHEELIVTWRISADLGTRTWNGTIAGGQRDGITDIAWELTVNNNQLRSFLELGARYPDISSHWFGGSDKPYIRFGTSNAASVLDTDGEEELKGTSLFLGASWSKSLAAYVPGSYTGEITLGWEHDSPSNVQIGEALLYSSGNSLPNWPFARVTFTPALDKAEYWRLYLTFVHSLVPA